MCEKKNLKSFLTSSGENSFRYRKSTVVSYDRLTENVVSKPIVNITGVMTTNSASSTRYIIVAHSEVTIITVFFRILLISLILASYLFRAIKRISNCYRYKSGKHRMSYVMYFILTILDDCSQFIDNTLIFYKAHKLDCGLL